VKTKELGVMHGTREAIGSLLTSRKISPVTFRSQAELRLKHLACYSRAELDRYFDAVIGYVLHEGREQ